MGKLPRFNDLQLRQVRRLIRKHCCNFQDGNCCTLDDGIDPSCAQWNSYSLQCTWFRDAVLPLAPELQEKVLGVSSQYKQCVLCRRYFIPSGNRAIYCPNAVFPSSGKRPVNGYAVTEVGCNGLAEKNVAAQSLFAP